MNQSPTALLLNPKSPNNSYCKVYAATSDVISTSALLNTQSCHFIW